MSEPVLLLSLIVFLPAIAAVLLWFVPGKNHDAIRYITLSATIAVLALCVLGFLAQSDSQFNAAQATMQNTLSLPWIPSFNINYFMGMDGISFPLVMLTALVSVFAMGASWSITKHVKGYCILFLLLETGMLGVFLALDFFLFYVFWEVMLLPMYFLIGVWGGPRREYAAIKFFLYTLVGSVAMLIAILMLYFNSDLRQVAAVSDLHDENARVSWADLSISAADAKRAGYARTGGGLDADLDLVRTGATADRQLNIQFAPAADDATATTASYSEAANVVTVSLHPDHSTAREVAEAMQTERVVAIVKASVPKTATGTGIIVPGDDVSWDPIDQKAHTFNLLALAACGQHTDCFDKEMLFGLSLQWWAFVLLFIGFAIKVPAVPVHTWLPDAHVEAPTPISMILAGVLLKMGGYGIIRICYPICPAGGYELAWAVCGLGVVSMVYGAFAAMAQTDFKRLVAYSSVSHMGYVVLGLGVWSASSANGYNYDYWNMGIQGAMFQMIAHGISSTGMFFMVGVIYDRVHHRNLNEFGGLFGKMPVYTALAIGIFFAGLGLPGLCGFVGEVLVVLAVFNYSITLAVISAAVVILTAGYILWAIQRVYLGAEYKGPHEEALVPATMRENVIATALFILAIVFGVIPHHTLLKYMDSTITQQASDLAAWQEEVGDADDSGEAVSAMPATPSVEDSARTTPAVSDPAASPRAVALLVDRSYSMTEEDRAP